MVLAVVAMSSTSTPGTARPEDGAGGGHAVVRVAVHDAAVQRGRADDESVGGFFGVAAEAVDFGDEGGEPVRFVAAEVGDAAQPRGAGGEGAQRGDGGREFAGLVEVARP